MIVVVLSAPTVAKFFVFTELALPAIWPRLGVGDNSVAILTARQFASRSHKPVKLKIYNA